MNTKFSARIIGIGSYVPEHVLSNADLEKMVETNDEWIVKRTGIRERRIAKDDQTTSDLALPAIEKALEQAKIPLEQIDLILVATMTPDTTCPSTASWIQKKIGAKGIPVMDLSAACCGFVYGLASAKAFIQAGIYQTVLLVAAEKMSSFVDFNDRSSCVLFGDGASAAVIANSGEGLVIDALSLGADGSFAEKLWIPAGGTRCPATAQTVDDREHYINLEGKEVFKHAVRQMAGCAKSCLESAGINIADLALVVPHQANERIIDAVNKQLGLSSDVVFKTVEKYGNTSASSIPIALGEAIKDRQFKSGDSILLTAFGAGFTWGACLLKVEQAESKE